MAPPSPSLPSLRLRLVVSCLAAVLVASAWLGPLDARGAAYVERGLERALLTFASARTLNGVISVVQGTEVAVQPAGVGMTLAPGQVLDPVNDLVERFSSVMLFAATSLGIQRVLLEISAWWPFNLLLAGLLGLAVACLWWPSASRRVGRPAWRLALLVIALRFFTPLAAMVGEACHASFLADRYTHARSGLEKSETALGALGETAAGSAQDGSLFERARAVLDVDQRVAAVRRAAGDVTDRTIDLIVVFVIETVLVPLGLLWLLLLVVRRLTHGLFTDVLR